MSDTNNEVKKIDSAVLKKIKGKIDQLVDNGSTLDHAISVVCRVNGFNPKTVKDKLNKTYNIEDKEEKKNYQDIKNDEGSYVMLKKNPGKEYEVININNKDNIVISDLDNDTELKVKEEEIIPIVTETKMNKKLNEAQYTVSIDNLETTDAETLSQMLSLAGQAEQPVATEMPMDTMAEPAPVMDYEPTIPSTMDGPGFEAAEVDSMPADEFPSPAEEPTVDDMGYGAPVDDMPVVDAEEDVVLPAEETEIMGESVEGVEEIEEGKTSRNPWRNMTTRQKKIMDLVDMWCENIASAYDYIPEEDILRMSRDVKMKPNELKKLIKRIGYRLENDESSSTEGIEKGLSEDVLVPSSEKEEKADATTAEEDAGDSMFEKCKKIIDGIKEEVGDDADDVSNKVFALKEMGNLSEEEYDYIVEHFDELCECGLAEEDWSEEDLKADVEAEKRLMAKDIEDEYEYDEPKEDVDECGVKPIKEDDYDAEIAETLRLAGVQLDEVSEEIALAGKKDLPMPPIGKANPAAKEDAKAQEPNYQKPATEKVMGYEATLGFENPANVGLGICVKETVNKDKIASILETARHMYAKKDSSEWLALDRRYVEKLLKEGVGYTNASKMLLKAKAGK